MGDLSWEAILCAAVPVAFIAWVLVRAIVRKVRRRGLPASGPTAAKDAHVDAFEKGRPPVDPDQWLPPGGI